MGTHRPPRCTVNPGWTSGFLTIVGLLSACQRGTAPPDTQSEDTDTQSEDTDARSFPRDPIYVDGSWRDVAVSWQSTCALTTDGHIQCWGLLFPDEVPQGGGFRAISITDGSGCALDEGGRAHCWGYLADSIPPEVPLDAVWVSIERACGIRSDTREILCWGPAVEPQVPAPPGPVLDLDISTEGTIPAYGCAVQAEDGRLACWGSMPEGIPRTVEGEYTEVAVAEFALCALPSGGGVRCFIGPGGGDQTLGTAVLHDLELGDYAYPAHRCGIDPDDNLRCWGGSPIWWFYYPPEVRVTAVAVGPYYACGVLLDQRLICWGGVPHEF